MKKDIDALMEKHQIDALLITGPAGHNPPMQYFTGNVHIGHGDLIKKRGEEPVLFCNPMEREEAARSGIEIKNLAEYRLSELMKEVDNDPAKATALRYKKMFSDISLTSGKLSIYGLQEAGQAYRIFNELKAILPDIEIIGEMGHSVLSQAMETKDEDEAKHLRHMGKVTTEIVGRVQKFIQSHKSKDGVVVKTDGTPLTIGDVKSKINLWAAELDVENPHGTIFAIGADSGVPHNGGNPTAKLELGKTIVFDIFLQQAGGGYHSDFTRTWCLGYAPEAEQKLYDDVRKVFDNIMEGLELNAPFAPMQALTCQMFEDLGHETIRQNPMITEGYVHSLGHGLGLRIHEAPGARDEKAFFKTGVAVTIEPGLYYPSKGMGSRIEDTVYVNQEGTIELLTDYPYDLVIPIEEA